MDIEYLVKKELIRRKYSPRTIESYLFCINKFFSVIDKEPSKISKVDVKEYLNKLSEKDKAGSTINLYLNALKFFFEEILKKKMKLDIRYSKVARRLPIILTKEEVKALFNNIKNEKHKLMIQLMYSAGLRVSELINLKVEDINFNDNYGWVRHGKGDKDRLFILANSLKDNLRKSIGAKKLNEYDYLFTNNRKSRYSTRTLQEIIKKARKSAKINKRISCHTLRHSFATHLIENGSSISEVQLLLGHQSPETTMVYIHTASPKLLKTKSPFDSL